MSRHTSESRGGQTIGALAGTIDDSFSSNDVFFNPSPASAMGSAPVIPTSAQFGLAIVTSTGPPSLSGNSTSAETLTDESPLTSGVNQTMENHLGTERTSDQERDHVHNR